MPSKLPDTVRIDLPKARTSETGHNLGSMADLPDRIPSGGVSFSLTHSVICLTI